MKLIIPKSVHNKLMYWTRKEKTECSGFGYVDIQGEDIYVHDAIMAKQLNSSGDTEIDPEDLTLKQYEHRTQDKPGRFKLWWHTHGPMSVFWSGTDHKNIAELMQHGWFSFLVLNHDGKMKAAYGQPSPKLLIDDIDVVIQEELTDLSDLNKVVRDIRAAHKSGDLNEVYDLFINAASEMSDPLITEETIAAWDAEFEAHARKKVYKKYDPKNAGFKRPHYMGHTPSRYEEMEAGKDDPVYLNKEFAAVQGEFAKWWEDNNG